MENIFSENKIILIYAPVVNGTFNINNAISVVYPEGITNHSSLEEQNAFYRVLTGMIANGNLPNHFVKKHIPEGYIRDKEYKIQVFNPNLWEKTDSRDWDENNVYFLVPIEEEPKVSAKVYRGLQRKVVMLQKENKRLRNELDGVAISTDDSNNILDSNDNAVTIHDLKNSLIKYIRDNGNKLYHDSKKYVNKENIAILANTTKEKATEFKDLVKFAIDTAKTETDKQSDEKGNQNNVLTIDEIKKRYGKSTKRAAGEKVNNNLESKSDNTLKQGQYKSEDSEENMDQAINRLADNLFSDDSDNNSDKENNKKRRIVINVDPNNKTIEQFINDIFGAQNPNNKSNK